MRCSFAFLDGDSCSAEVDVLGAFCALHADDFRPQQETFSEFEFGTEATLCTPAEFSCTWCDLALQLLDEHNFRVTVRPMSTPDLKAQFGENFTVPRIFIGDRLVGGYADLCKELHVEMISVDTK